MPNTIDRPAIQLRLRQVRTALYGPEGVAKLANDLGIPARSWHNFENGVGMPDVVLLKFLHLTGTDPHWLLTGVG